MQSNKICGYLASNVNLKLSEKPKAISNSGSVLERGGSFGKRANVESVYSFGQKLGQGSFAAAHLAVHKGDRRQLSKH